VIDCALRWQDCATSAAIFRHSTGSGAQRGIRGSGNPERSDDHRLIRHADADVIREEDARDFATLRSMVLGLGESGIEGVVWHHPDGRMAKLKGRDFPA
jgi:hypothetical protein